MTKSENKRTKHEMTITIPGHEVMLQFAEKADPEIALRVKQALLGTYPATNKYRGCS